MENKHIKFFVIYVLKKWKFTPKCTKIPLVSGLISEPAEDSGISAPPDPLSVKSGVILQRRETFQLTGLTTAQPH